MKKYIGVKIIEAEEADRSKTDKRVYTNTEPRPSDEEYEEGYKVVYPDGYISWSPREVFEEAYRLSDGMTFGLAVEATGKGFCIAREGWNGKNMHVTRSKLYTPDNIQINNDCLLLFNVTGKYNTWVPSITDILAEDWRIVK